MTATAEATAVAPKITGKEIAVHTVKTIGGTAHLVFTALAEVSKISTARIINKMDGTPVQQTMDEIHKRTEIKLAPMIHKLSGYPDMPESEE